MGIKAALLRMGMAISLAAVATAFLVAAVPDAPAGASGYPPPTTPPNASCSATETIDVGSSFTYEVTCLFAPNATVTVTANGDPYNTGTANASGVFTEAFVVSAGPHVALNGGAAVAAAYGGTTTFVATGPDPQGGTTTATTRVVVPTASTAAAVSGSGSGSDSPLAFTGMDLLATVVAGLALLAMGTAVVMYARRRSGRSAPGVRPG